MPSEPDVLDLGRTPYDDTHKSMLVLADSVCKGEEPGKILLVEHHPVYTAGRGTRAGDGMDGATPVERGGGITYHGPGQLVVYPIVRLPRRDVHAWLRALEELGIGVCRSLGLEAERSGDGTGVFISGRKVISIGVAIRRWVNLHGIAINVDLDLSAFQSIRPCGLDPTIMSDLCRAADRKITMEQTKQAVRANLGVLANTGPVVTTRAGRASP